jgi:predicted transcriptional regulator
MPAIEIRKRLWDDLLAVAEKRRRKPESIANRALQDFLRREADEELLRRSTAAARRSSLRAKDAEDTIRRYRRKRHAL